MIVKLTQPNSLLNLQLELKPKKGKLWVNFNSICRCHFLKISDKSYQCQWGTEQERWQQGTIILSPFWKFCWLLREVSTSTTLNKPSWTSAMELSCPHIRNLEPLRISYRHAAQLQLRLTNCSRVHKKATILNTTLGQEPESKIYFLH